MKEELDEALVRDFPLLFADRHASMMETCMCWGFPGDGWEPIIREAAEKLEPLIKKYVDSLSLKGRVCICGEHITLHEDCSGRCIKVYHLHRGKKLLNFFTKCSRYSMPYKVYNSKSIKDRAYVALMKAKSKLFHKAYVYAYRFFWFLADRGISYVETPSSCQKFQLNHPRASQIKEKYGTLRFYLTSCSDEMLDVCNEAEEKSAHICEFCGAPGKLREGGWLITLCDECDETRHGSRKR